MRNVSLSTIADVTAGQGAPKPDEFSDSGIPFVRAGSLEGLISGKKEKDLELVPEETAKKHKLKLYPKGSILFAKSGMSATKGRIYVLRNPAYVVSHLAILTPNDNVYTEYLRLVLKQFPPSVLIKDLAYPAIGLGDIQGYKIPVPEKLDDQKRISYLLGKMEELIARRKKHLKQLDDLIKSVFLEMFGDPVRNEKGWGIYPTSIVVRAQSAKHEKHQMMNGAFLSWEQSLAVVSKKTRTKPCHQKLLQMRRPKLNRAIYCLVERIRMNWSRHVLMSLKQGHDSCFLI
jgi:type I restriction enzyme S subunit